MEYWWVQEGLYMGRQYQEEKRHGERFRDVL